MRIKKKIFAVGLIFGWLFLVSAIAAATLINNGDGTVSDTETGLMWQQAKAGAMNWQNALAYCEGLVLPVGGYDDWRLPDRHELQSLVDYSRYNPCLDKTFFPGVVSSYYWSSTTYAGSTGNAWRVYFDDGHVGDNYKSYSYYVRAVRSGQSGPLDDLAILTISPTSRTVAAGAGTTTFAVSNTGDGNMAWTAATGDDWLNITSGSSGTNDGTVTVSYGAIPADVTSRTGTVTVSAPSGEGSPKVVVITQTRDTSLAGKLQHFVFSTISSPQEMDASFPVTVTAKDANNQTVTDFSGRVSLFSSLGRVNPTALTCSAGTATTNVTLYEAGETTLKCSGAGASGESNNFTVNGLCQCLSDVSGSLVDTNNDPVVGAEVSAVDVSGLVAVTVVSDSEGKYFFNDLPCGSYVVKVKFSVDGCSYSRTITYIKADGDPVEMDAFELQINTTQYGTPVILVPGIMGSASYDKIVSCCFIKGKVPGLNHEKPAPNVKIFNEEKYGWKSLFDYLQDDFRVVKSPWDWRLGADEAAREYLIPAIDEALKVSTTGKVHIVAHSMGGLLSRALIQSDIICETGEKYYEKIDKLVMIGTPHLGSCNAYYIWEGGDPKGLDDLVASGPTNAYSRVLQELWEGTYNKIEKWDTDKHCSIVDFLVSDVSGGYDHPSSLRQLMYTGEFLALEADRNNSSRWWGVTTSGNENKWLKALNTSPNTARMGATGADGKIETLVLAGNGKDTIKCVVSQKTFSNCPSGPGGYLDGAPVGPVSKAKNVNWLPGDGTVPLDSAIYPATRGWARNDGNYNRDTEHGELPGQFNEQVYTFLAGQSKTTATASPRTAGDEVFLTLTFRIDNGQRFIIEDPFGNRAGIDPASDTLVKEIVGASILFDGRQGVITLPDPVDGNYLLTFFGGPQRNFDLEISCSADEILDAIEKSGFSPADTATVTIALDSSADPAISLNPPIIACENLAAEPYDNGSELYTRLTWGDQDDAASYRIYTIADTEPYYHKLADVAKASLPEYDTAELWRDSEDAPLRVYVVTMIDASGNESFFSNKVYNDDRDGDRLTDLEEVEQGTLVDNPDSDDDGLQDGDEVFRGTFPDDPDSDDDGYDDYGEVQGESDPRFADIVPDLHVNADGVCNGEYYCYPTLAAACAAAQGLGSIRVGQGEYPENLTLSENKFLTMSGGWNSDYTSAAADSVMVGRLTISSGCLTVERLVIGGQSE